MLVATKTLLVHRAVRMMRPVMLLLLWRMVGTRRAEIIVQLAAYATLASDECIFENFRVIIVLTRVLLLLLDHPHNEGFESLCHIVRLTDAHMIYAEKAMSINACKLLEFLTPFVVNYIGKLLFHYV